MLDITPDTGDEPGHAGTRTLGLHEITARPVVFRCMGRSYSAASHGGAVVIHDITDITRPLLLGAAEAAGDGIWDIRTSQGLPVRQTVGALDAVAALREATWPPRDQCPGLPAP